MTVCEWDSKTEKVENYKGTMLCLSCRATIAYYDILSAI